MAFFYRLSKSGDKGTDLLDAVEALNRAAHSTTVCLVDTRSFSAVPSSPFCYWVSDSIRTLFANASSLESHGREAQRGAYTVDDFRFLRCWWEICASSSGRDRTHTCHGGRWVPLAKGGSYSRYYSDLHLVIDWMNDGEVLKTHLSEYRGGRGWGYQWTAALNGYSFYFRPAVTWPRSTVKGLSARPLPSGSIFGDKGPCIFIPGDEPKQLACVLGLMNSRVFEFLFFIQHGSRAWEVGVIQRTPIPPGIFDNSNLLADLATSAWMDKRLLDSLIETSHTFRFPVLTRVIERLASCGGQLKAAIAECEKRIATAQREIDLRCFSLYGISDEDREAIESVSISMSGNQSDDPGTDYDDPDGDSEECPVTDLRDLGSTFLSYGVGCTFGRWDVLHVPDDRAALDMLDVFAQLPICSPGMLQGDDGLPASKAPPGYPLRISWGGVLVDDLGFGEGAHPHREDVVRRVRDVLDLLWGDRAEAIEHEACEILDVRDLREYFRNPSRFYDDHLKRYSKSRRKAPIYWPLSTASGSYAVWIYYHRLTDQTLYSIVNEYVEPKMAETERWISRLEERYGAASGREAAQLGDRLQEASVFLGELVEFRAELLRVAELPYKPDLNDGVIINAAPLHRLFRHRGWARDTQETWRKLESGEYDWAHMALNIWPERVKQICRRDRSIAIAHGLEELYEAPATETKPRRGRQGAASA
jgi:hypothetical protein